MIEEARTLGDYLIAVVNNDNQQLLKKGKIILDEMNRMRLMSALRAVDEVMLSIDNDPSQNKTLREIMVKYPHDTLVFANGGDRDGHRAIPETEVCDELGIELVFGVGSAHVIKRDSSTRINQETGHEVD